MWLLVKNLSHCISEHNAETLSGHVLRMLSIINLEPRALGGVPDCGSGEDDGAEETGISAGCRVEGICNSMLHQRGRRN